MKKLFFFVMFLIPSLSYATVELSTQGTNIGIGTSSQRSSLSIRTNLAVGSTTYTSTAAPANGAIIEGNVGVGTLNPQARVDITGSSASTGTALKVKNSSNVAKLVVMDSGNVGIGTMTPQGRLSIHGGGLAAETINKGWELIIPSPSEISVSGVTTNEVNSFGIHKGNLYIGYNTQGNFGSSLTNAPIYKWDGATLTYLTTLGTGQSFRGLTFIKEYKGNLYAGINGSNAGDGDVYVSTDDGATWTRSYNNASDYFAYAAEVFNGKLYVGFGYTVSEIYSFDGSSWTQAYAGKAEGGMIIWMKAFKGRLYAAIGGGGTTAPGIISSADGTTWVVELNLTTTLASEVNQIEEFRGKLYATIIAGSGGTNDIYVRDDSTASWSIVATLTGSQAWGMQSYNDALYVGSTVSTGLVIYKSYDGVNFTSDFTTNGTASSGDTEAFKMITYDGSLYVGVGFQGSTTADIFRKTDSIGQLFDTNNRFHKKLRFNTDGYNYGNDEASMSLTSLMNFDTNVGIGTFKSKQTLDVNGTISATNIGIGSVAPVSRLDVSGNVYFSGGTVGIGTANPSAANANQIVMLYGTSNAARTIAVKNPTAGTGVQARFEVITADSNGFITQYPTTHTSLHKGRTYVSNETGNGLSLNSATGTIKLYINDAEKVTLDQNGNIGIGTAGPRKALEVSGSAIVSTNVGVGTTSPPNPLYVVGTPMFTTGLNIGIGTASPSHLCIAGNAVAVCNP